MGTGPGPAGHRATLAGGPENLKKPDIAGADLRR
jgi:hypothetical protein